MMKSSLLAILLVAVAANIGLTIKSCQREKAFAGIIQAKNDTIRTWQDDAGRWRSEATAARVTNADMKEFFAQESAEIRKDFDIKLKNVTAYLKASTRTQQTIVMPRDSTSTIIIRNADGSDTARFRYSDRWADIDATLNARELRVKYLVSDSLSFVTNWKSQGLFRPDRLAIDGISYNPNTKITGIDNIQVLAPMKRWGAGPVAGYGVAPPFGWTWFVGAGLQYRLVSW